MAGLTKQEREWTREQLLRFGYRDVCKAVDREMALREQCQQQAQRIAKLELAIEGLLECSAFCYCCCRDKQGQLDPCSVRARAVLVKGGE